MADALLLDLDGVLYVGDRAVPGVGESLRWLREEGIPHLFVTNTTSRPRAAIVEKLRRMGIDVDAEEILTPPVAAARWLEERGCSPVALFVPPATREDFAPLPRLDDAAEEGAGAVVVGDLGDGWDFATLNRAFRLLMSDEGAPLVALGATRYWRAPDGLRLDAGPFVKALEHAAGREAVVVGKPDAAFFEAALQRLGVKPEDTVMVGDDIVGDVDGAQRAGMRGVLVRTGKFRPADLSRGIEPAAVIDSIAALPGWWRRAG